ncbi:transferase family-domain-containing protein [Mycena sp. CBHHK59/15]|nr:transferase family-domain-containing protein [Mycena sp. CBHHK59/15]
MTSTSAGSVSVTSRHTVRCANETSLTALDSPFRLGPLDQLVAPFIPIAVVFIYEQPTSTPDVELIPVERRQRALTLLLDYYPHLTGRLQINPSDGTREITRLGRHRDPIFTVQHTRFACGGVALGVRLLHTVCDADGFFQFVRDLAELYRGVRSSEINDDPTSGIPSLAHPPHIRSYMSELSGGNMTPEERLAALDFQPSLFYVEQSADVEDGVAVDSSSSSTVTASFPPAPPPVVGRFLRFSSRELNALKAHATDPNGSPSSGSWISTFDALSAHLYQRVHRARLQLRAKDANQGELSHPDFLTPVNLRSRLGHDRLPPRYFPNALFTPYITLPLDVLANGLLWQVAKALHDVTRTTSTTSKEEMNLILRWITAQPDTRKIRPGFRYGNGSFMVSQWNKFDMYVGTVFEVRPVLVSTPFLPISLVDGLVYFLPTEEQGTEGDTGAIDVNLSLGEPLWGVMDQDEPNL